MFIPTHQTMMTTEIVIDEDSSKVAGKDPLPSILTKESVVPLL